MAPQPEPQPEPSTYEVTWDFLLERSNLQEENAQLRKQNYVLQRERDDRQGAIKQLVDTNERLEDKVEKVYQRWREDSRRRSELNDSLDTKVRLLKDRMGRWSVPQQRANRIHVSLQSTPKASTAVDRQIAIQVAGIVAFGLWVKDAALYAIKTPARWQAAWQRFWTGPVAEELMRTYGRKVGPEPKTWAHMTKDELRNLSVEEYRKQREAASPIMKARGEGRDKDARAMAEFEGVNSPQELEAWRGASANF